ncbi:hypothetical protein CJ030_MR7G001995 [Morella rubra]|uniref:PB1-like domain-containing protein n=1 Tax=Morella rubra TaxID=262757 RepID=A0A6A1WX78_9ROSI|nr:hypothetical protein CJ030_MR7G001995 [Morella rubra]
MVELFIHHSGSINFVSGTYTGGDISYIGKKDSDYLSVVVFYKFVREDLGYLNVTRLAWKFDEAVGPFKLLESDDDCRHLSVKIYKEQSKELHDGAGTSTGIEIPTNRNRETAQSMGVSTELRPPDRIAGRRARGVQRT